MALTTYSDLQTAIANYLARSDLSSQIPDFIRLAEIRLRRELRIRQMLKSVTTSTTGGDDTVQLPSDFLQIRDLYTDGEPVYPLNYMTPSLFTRNSRSYESGRPVDYTILADEFKFAPTPDTAYTLVMLYYSAPAFLSDTNTTNVWTVNAMDCLLYASLGEAEPYLMNDARLQVWGALYNRGIAALSESDDKAEFSASPLVMRVAAR
jgi:hypothetical protein